MSVEEAINAAQSAFPDAEVRTFDYDLSLAIALKNPPRAWRGDYYGGFDIHNPAHVDELIEMVRDQSRLCG